MPNLTLYTDYIISILKLFTNLDIERACGAEWVSEWLAHWQISIFTPHPATANGVQLKQPQRSLCAARIKPGRHYIHVRCGGRAFSRPPARLSLPLLQKEARVCCGCARKHRRAFCWLLNGWSICKYLSKGNTHIFRARLVCIPISC